MTGIQLSTVMSEENGWQRYISLAHFDIAQLGHWAILSVTTNPLPMTTCPLPLGVFAPFLADLFENVRFSPRLCCLFYRSLSLCCERLRLLIVEVNLTNLWFSPISIALVFFQCFLHFVFSFSDSLSILSLLTEVFCFWSFTRAIPMKRYTKSFI